MSILEFLGWGHAGQESAAEAETQTVRRIVEELNHMDPDRARFVAAFAYVLSRVASADLRVSDVETRAMEAIVAEDGGLPPEQAIIVVQMAKNQNLLFGGTENYLVTRELNRLASRDQKLALLGCLFRVSAADQSVTSAEDGVIRQIAAEMKLDHADFIAERAKVRDHLAVLKREEGAS